MKNINIVDMAKSKVVSATPVISDKLTNAIVEYTKSFNRNDNSSKDLFTILLSLHRTTKDSGALLIALGETYNKLSGGNSKIISNLRDITVLAKKANDNKVIIKLDLGYFYNIKEAIKLFEASNALNDKEAIQSEIRKELFECYSKDDTMINYNNKVSSKIKELRKNYNFVDIDGVTIVSTLKSKIDKLTKDELRELNTYINSKL